MPVLAIGGEKSFGPTMAVVAKGAAASLRYGKVVIPDLRPLADGRAAGGNYRSNRVGSSAKG